MALSDDILNPVIPTQPLPKLEALESQSYHPEDISLLAAPLPHPMPVATVDFFSWISHADMCTQRGRGSISPQFPYGNGLWPGPSQLGPL